MNAKTAVPGVGVGGGCHLLSRCLVWGCYSWNFLKRILCGNSCFLVHFQPEISTHFHSRLYYVHPARGNTGRDYDGTWDKGARKLDVLAKTGQVVILLPSDPCRKGHWLCYAGPTMSVAHLLATSCRTVFIAVRRQKTQLPFRGKCDVTVKSTRSNSILRTTLDTCQQQIKLYPALYHLHLIIVTLAGGLRFMLNA